MPRPEDAHQSVPTAAVAIGETRYAGFWIRLATWAIDAFVLAVSFVILLVSGLGFLVVVFGPMIYYVVLTGLRRQTVGKMVVGIKVVFDGNRNPGIGRAAIREIIGKFISIIAFCLGFLWVIWNPRRQGLARQDS